VLGEIVYVIVTGVSMHLAQTYQVRVVGVIDGESGSGFTTSGSTCGRTSGSGSFSGAGGGGDSGIGSGIGSASGNGRAISGAIGGNGSGSCCSCKDINVLPFLSSSSHHAIVAYFVVGVQFWLDDIE